MPIHPSLRIPADVIAAGHGLAPLPAWQQPGPRQSRADGHVLPTRHEKFLLTSGVRARLEASARALVGGKVEGARFWIGMRLAASATDRRVGDVFSRRDASTPPAPVAWSMPAAAASAVALLRVGEREWLIAISLDCDGQPFGEDQAILIDGYLDNRATVIPFEEHPLGA